jgi:glycosyltransferase involved in cell wall biosynthesis
MFVSIAICTLNRAESLRRTLDSLLAMHVPDDLAWEIVVINNGCSDHTDEVIASFAGRLPIRREVESHRGLSRARNRAIESARGEYILWTDDDVVVDPEWLAAYAAAFRRWPTAAIFGGPIVPKFETPIVEWVGPCKDLLRSPYAARDLGPAPILLSKKEGRIPFGANFAIRAAEQSRFRYDINLGLAPGRERLSEDTVVVERILAAGGIGYWVPDARVDHWIGHGRQTTGYVIRYFAALGETSEILRTSALVGPRWLGVPRWMWRQVVEHWIRYRVHRLFSPPPVWMMHLQNYGRAKGRVRYWWNR